ncbi:hypothetical protein BH11PLA1_BH11PLA1_08450 [soil metagenome]
MNVENVTKTLKKRAVPIGLGVLVLIALPTAWYFSTTMRAKNLTEIEKKISADASELTGAKVNYSVKPLLADAAPVEHSAVPNEVLNNYFKAKRDVQTEQSAQLYAEALKINEGRRVKADGEVVTLVPGVLPNPSDIEVRVKTDQFVRELIDRAPKRLLDRVKAGWTPDAANVGAELKEAYETSVKSKLPPGKNDPKLLSQTEIDEIRTSLTGLRVEKFKRAAQSFSIYADDATAFRLPPLQGMLENLPTLAQTYDLQIQYYVMEDIIAAIAKANEAGGSAGVPGSVVKRIEQIIVAPRIGNSGAGGGAPSPDGTPPIVASAGPEVGPDAGVMPSNFASSVTGRVSGPGSGNNLYDLKQAEVRVVVSAKNLPKFLNALAQTNFMSVLDLDVTAVDSNEELRQGFYYGEEPVVRASIRLETIWLREWTRKIMPKEIRDELGVPDLAPPTPAAPAATPDAPTG